MTRRLLIPATLLGLTLAACSDLPADSGRGDVAKLLSARGQEVTAAGDADAAHSMLRQLSQQPLTVTDAVRLALLNNPALTATYARLGFASAEVYDAGRPDNPRLSASVLIPDVGRDSDQIGLGIAQNFSNLLLLPARSRFASSEFESVKKLVGAAVLELAADTEAAYYRLVGAIQIAAMREAICKAADASSALAQRFSEAGNINGLQLALEQAAASEARLNLLQAQAESTAARGALNQLMGLPATASDWQIAGRLSAPVTTEDSLPDLLQRATVSRLDLIAARGNVSRQTEVLGLTRRFRLLGDMEVGVETERETDRSRITGPTLVLELPIFNQGKGRIARAEAGLQQAEAELRTLEISISNAVQQAHAKVAATRTRGELYRVSLIPQREAIVANTQAEVNFMLTGQFELLLAKQQEYAAYQGYLEAVRDYWLARVELARAVGAPLPSAAQIGEATLDTESLTKPKGGMGHMHHNGMQMDGMEGMDHSGHDMKSMDHAGHTVNDMKPMVMPAETSDQKQSGEQP